MLRKAAQSFLLLAVATGAYMAGAWQGPRDTTAAASATAPRVAYYHCPMHPSYKSDKPGTAPCCGMDLEPVMSDAALPAPAAHAPAAIAVTPDQQQAIGVTVAAVREEAASDHLRMFGLVAAEETRIHKVNIGIDAYIRELTPATTGTYVKKHQWLARFSTPEMRNPIGSLITATDVLAREEQLTNPAGMEAARNSMEIAIDRLLTLGMSPLQIEDVKRTKLLPPTVTISSPIDGFLIARNVTLGEKIGRGMELFQVADLRQVWILADVPLAEGNSVKPGTPAEIRIPGLTSPLRAIVSRDVLPQFDSTTQSFKVRLEADNRGFALRPGMFVDVDVQLPAEQSIVIPADAVIASGLRNRVFVETSPGTFEPREIQVGRRHQHGVTVMHGLHPGERIAVSGTFLLDSETRMKAHGRSDH
jgi:Cu(I)/Ag(I) efflux system membrane fusion protein